MSIKSKQQAWREGNWKLVVQADGFSELYHLAEDPHELVNPADEIVWSTQLNKMQQSLQHRMKELGEDGFVLRPTRIN